MPIFSWDQTNKMHAYGNALRVVIIDKSLRCLKYKANLYKKVCSEMKYMIFHDIIIRKIPIPSTWIEFGVSFSCSKRIDFYVTFKHIFVGTCANSKEISVFYSTELK